ncbi:hypothetical protein HCA15_14075 [Listeria booriae]|uniref:hypothetical protein n=1 Tax=Listeria booriae TaxID=1552123 RepID=UPI0016260823|nr:hypothetical protein [Listeria booriae]MBC1945116.1 hypothetical protein [Listeria booriae]MBC6167776.1 hypothetical protein [Listeria booriae]
MRYPDIIEAYAGFDPLQENITTNNPYIVGVHAPDSKVYMHLNDSTRRGVTTDDGGKFEYVWETLHVGDAISMQSKNGTNYEEFWVEMVRE